MCGICVDDQSVYSPVAGIGSHERAARLHRVGNQPLLPVVLLDRHLGIGERLLDLARPSSFQM